MRPPALPENESLRVETLGRMDLIGVDDDERCQRYARLVRRLFDVPMAAVTIVGPNDQWFRGREGLAVSGTPREVSFCGHAILQAEPFYIPDASKDDRFADNPLVTGEPHIRFYASCPLFLPGDIAIGTLCVIDSAPRTLDDTQLQLLRDLADCLQSEFTTLLSVADMNDIAKDLFRMLPGKPVAA